ncbi:hypothetical protein CKAH01_12222 [Colletotrichum kahawae]|uniref:Uncharacterized protein n=1 Tax=Colletotrichum kahawae TaxID=34407 RepID=A0AAD9YUY7_COLKA|nr:hypothetical protein CKAH01_12222 [Colletotrichum kahawae]
MVDSSDPSALSYHRSPSAKTEGPGFPYEIYLLIVDAFLDSAHAKVSAQPGFWRFKNERRCGTNGYLPPRLVLCRDWGQIALRHHLLRGISQTDLESQKRVNRQFPRFPYRDIWIKQDCIDYPGFAYICPSVDLFEPDHEPGYTTQAGLLRALFQPTPVNSELLQVMENIQLYGWCVTDPDLPCFLFALPNLRTVSFVWEPPSSDWPSPPALSSHAHQNPPTIYESEQDDGITERLAILRRCSFAWEKGIRLLYCSHEDRAWPGHWPSNELLFDPTLGELPFRIIQFVAGCKDCLDALPRYSLRERSAGRLRPSSFGLIPVVDDAYPSVTLNDA